MELTIKGTQEEITKLLQTIISSKEQNVLFDAKEHSELFSKHAINRAANFQQRS